MSVLFVLTAAHAQRMRIRSMARINYVFGEWRENDSTVYSYRPGQGSIDSTENTAKEFASCTLFTHDYDKWEPKSYHTNQYDKAGRYTGYSEKTCLRGRCANSVRCKIIYNDAGDSINIYIEAWDTTARQWSDKDRSSTSYDERHRLVETIRHPLPEMNYHFTPIRDSIFYNGLDSVDHDVHYELRDDKWIPTKKRTYTYNKAGRMIFKHTYLFNPVGKEVSDTADRHAGVNSSPDIMNRWLLTYVDSMAYDSAGRNISQIIYTWSKDDPRSRMGMRRLHIFDERGDEVRKTFDVYWDKEHNRTDSMVYDKAHHLIDRYSWTNDPTDWWRFLHTAYTYDPSGHKTGVSVDSWVDGQWQHISREEYHYDSAGYRTSFMRLWTNDGPETPTDIVYTHYEPVK